MTAPPSPASSPNPTNDPVAAAPVPPPVPPDQRVQAEACFRKAEADFTKRFYDQAIAGYTETPRLNPQHALAFVQRATAYFYQHAYDRVVADCTEAIRIDPKLSEAYHHRGYAFIHLGQYDQAVADLTEALRLNPKLSGASEMLKKAEAKAEEERGNRRGAVQGPGKDGKKRGMNPVVHIIQGAGGLLVGFILLFTPLQEWGLIVVILSAIFFFYGLAKYTRTASRDTVETGPDPFSEKIAKLAQLRDSGVISEAEYQEKKGELLRRI